MNSVLSKGAGWLWAGLALSLWLSPGGRALAQGGFGYGKKEALVIGINKLRGPGADALALSTKDLVAERDAEDVGKRLRESYGFHVTSLLGKDATRQGILDALARAVDGMTGDDVLIVFYAGHGMKWVDLDNGMGKPVTAGYLVPAGLGARPATRSVGAYDEWLVPMSRVTDEMRRSRARHTLLLLDCCYSGLAGATRGGGDGEQGTGTYRYLMEHDSWYVITAGTDGQKAFEPVGKNNGAFTLGLLRALDANASKTDPFSATELFLSLRSEVLSLAQAEPEPRELDPQIRALKSSRGELVLVPPAGEKEFEAKAAKSSKAAESRRSENRSFSERMKNVNKAKDRGGSAEEDSEWKEEYARTKEQAAAGDESAMTLLYYMNLYGLGTRRDPRRAYAWANDAASTTSPMGQMVLADCYEQGVYVSTNRDEAARLRAGITQENQQTLRDMFAGKDVPPEKAAGAIIGFMGLAAQNSGRNAGKSSGSTVVGQALLSISDFFSASDKVKECKDIQEAMAAVEARGADLHRHYDEMARRNSLDDDKARKLTQAWARSVGEVERLAATTPRAQEMTAAAASLRKSLTELDDATKDGGKNAIAAALLAADQATRSVRTLVGEKPAAK